MRLHRLLVVCGIALSATAACSVPSSDFTPSQGSGSNPDANVPLAMVLSDTAITVGEGASQGFTVALNRAPGGKVKIAVTTTSTKIGIMSAELDFDDTDWQQPQTETISGLQDPDTLDEQAVVNLAASGVGDVEAKQVNVTVKDDDVLAILTDATPNSELDVDEGSTLDIHVHLSAQPQGDVVIAANFSPTTPMWVTPTTLTFDPDDYGTDQVITITAPVDANTVSEMQTLTLGTADSSLASVSFSVKDVDKDVLNIKTDVSSLIVTEQGAPGTIQVSLTQQPSNDVTVSLMGSTGAVTIAPTTLTFTSTNYNQPQAVSVTGNADPDTVDNSDTITLSATGLANKTVAVTVHDDDVQAILDSVNGTFTVTEDQTGTFDVWLAYQPQADTQVTVTSMSSAVASVSPGVLTFTKQNYDQHQTVTVSGTDDQNLVTNNTTIQLVSSPIPTVSVPVAVPDADHQAILLSKNSTSILEPNSDTIMVSLQFDPGGSVTLGATSGNVGVAVTPTLTFNSSNYSTPQPLVIQALSDPDADSIDTTVTVSGAGATSQSIAVHVTDDNVLAITSDATATVDVNEGSSVSITAHLTAKPDNNVTVQVVIPSGTAISSSPTSATFTPTNYGTDVTFVLSAADDVNTTDEDTPITLHSTTAGIPDVSFDLHTFDKDKLGIVVDKSTMTVTEQGAAGAINVSLTNQPPSTVTVNLADSNGLLQLGAASLTFTTSNWSTPQPVSVYAPADADTVNNTSTITVSSPSISGSSPTVNVTIIDDDTQAIMTDAASLSLAENGTSTFHVWLAYQPVASTTVTIASANAGVATVAPASLTFTPQSYATHQAVTVTGTHDQNLVTNSTNVTASEPTIGTVTIPTTVTDIDTQKIVLTPASQTIMEGATGSVSVSLQFDPGTSTAITLGSSNAAITLGATQATFTSANYSTPQQVTLSAPVDSNTISETSTITATGAGTSATVTAMVQDTTVLATYGWPTYFGQSSTSYSGTVMAFKIHVDVATTLDVLGLVAGTAGGDYRMAIYDDGGNIPGALEVDSGARATISQTGTNQVSIVDHPLAVGYYWIAYRVDPQASLGTGSSVQTGPACVRNTNIANLDDPWPTSFGSATCATIQLTNLFITTHHQ